VSGSAEFSPEQRTRSPYLIVGAATLLHMVSYVDRSCISVAAPSIGREFGLTPTQLGIVFSSFFLSYALLQMPWGAAADRIGPRKIVTFAILAWSACTALTGAALNYLMLVIVRVAFGSMEAALNPAITTALARWVPDNWRTTAFGIFLGGGRVGGAFAPALAVFLLLRYGWRSTFVVIAASGILAAGAWLLAVPANLPVNRASQTFERAGVRLWSIRMSALLMVVFGYTFMWQFYATWFPTYLIERRGYTLSQAGWYASLPFLLGIGSNWIGGILCDAASRKIGLALGRGALGFCSIFFSALLFYCGIIGSAKSSPWLLAAAAGVGDIFLPIAWTVAADLGGKSAGAFAGLMNSASNLGGFVSPILLGAAIQHWKNWDSALLMGVGATLLAAFLWIPVSWPSRTDARLTVSG
jgi:MFS transporter, ACS family, glucarate transporter